VNNNHLDKKWILSEQAYNALREIAKIYEREAKLDKLVQVYEKMLVSFPKKDYFENSKKLAFLYVERSNYKRASKILEELIDYYSPQDDCLYNIPRLSIKLLMI